ncbi:MAG TPA: OmpW family outer membrane protein [Hyphomicrobiaceae bacterium]|nr:OmpW family outer membrane protein [Hyphomicrobiaceae bacterium]
MGDANKLIASLALTVAVTLWAVPACAGSETGNFMVRVLGTVVDPDASGTVRSDGTVLAAANPIPGSDADVSTELIPALTLTYFFNKNLAVELFCCFAKLDADAEGSIKFLGEVAEFWIFPPALTLQYHFNGMGGFKPYVGAGLQYIAFFDEDGGPYGQVEIDDAVGFTLQAGADVTLGGGWHLNADVKKTWIETEVDWKDVGLKGDVDVDPWIFSAGLGYRFNLEDIFGRRAEAVPMK